MSEIRYVNAVHVDVGNDQFHVEWLDGMGAPKLKPDPNYPDGKDVDLSACRLHKRTCKVEVPHPAKRIGCYYIACLKCEFTCAVSTAGRLDDPRSVTLPCKESLRSRLGLRTACTTD